MVKIFVTIYNWFHRFRMRKQRLVLDGLRNTDVTTLNTLDKIVPILKSQLDLLQPMDLRFVTREDIYDISIIAHWLSYDFYTIWLKKALNTIAKDGNRDNVGYIDINNQTSGYSTLPMSTRMTKWLPWNILDEDEELDLNLFYGRVKQDIEHIEATMSTVTDPFFKNYYDKKFASALQDLLLVVFTLNEMVAFYEWRK